MRSPLLLALCVVCSHTAFAQKSFGLPTFEDYLWKHTNADVNGDGVKEIDFLRPLPFEVPGVPALSTSKRMVIVLVESRLLSSTPTSSELITALSVLRQDMINEGYAPRFVEAQVYAGALHQDGRTVLALRRFLKDVRANFPSLMGCVLIGDFPDSTLVRRVMVRNDGVNATIGGTPVTNASTLSIVSEQIAVRADIVLSDLDGNWESLYVYENTTLNDVELIPFLFAGASFPYSGQSFASYQFNLRPAGYNDFFYIRDESTTVTTGNLGELFVSIGSTSDRNPELAPSDTALANPIARPEIEVTRINPKHVGVMPEVGGPTLDGQGALAADGKPRWVPVDPSWGQFLSVGWLHDAQHERRILLDYLARNHRFRTGSDATKPYRVGAIRSTDLALTGADHLADVILKPADINFGTSVVHDNKNLDGFIAWLKTSMTLRGVSSHADWIGSMFDAVPNAPATDTSVGGRPWAWRGVSLTQTQYYLKPTLDGVAAADLRLYRTLWENGTLANTAQSFWLHHGCSVNSVDYGNQPYNGPNYGYLNNAEAILFYANAMEVMARAKVFNDVPRNFGPSVSATKRFSSAFAGYVAAEAADASLNPAGAPSAANRAFRTVTRKKAYYWGVLGDLTLKLRY